uniref:Ankyrin repeat domain-containing protein 10 n=1 Tax=Phallusia mammillata TaxID=59560 RepID=A0A6F9D6L7_9ASCI|nr:ankyrin repeat domain-containing protein 10 [Phallusia mammillata]
MDSNNDTPLGFWGTESEEVISKQFPLHKACRDGDAVALSRLVAIATPDQMVAEDQFYGWTPIHWAAYFGKIDCLNGLLRTGVSVNIRTSRFKQTPAHISAFGGHPTALLELMKAGADFHARDYLGESPMHKAARVGNVECIKVLVTSGAHANICNDNGHTAGDLARMQNFIECARVLESAVANLTPIHAVNGFANGNSGAHVSNGNGHGPITNGGNGHVNGHQPMTNGWSGHVNGHHPITNGCSMRKRGYDDESIPSLKRARVADQNCTMQDHEMEADEDCPITPPETVTCFNDVCSPRAPSPGMELRYLEDASNDDLQAWGHLHGYGDTAEALPEICETRKPTLIDRNETFQKKLNGVRSRGWS